MATSTIFKTTNYITLTEKGSFTFSAPSNIALVKYWGKKDHQIPANPSLSFTLNHCKTITTLQFEPKSEKVFPLIYCLKDNPKNHFDQKFRNILNVFRNCVPIFWIIILRLIPKTPFHTAPALHLQHLEWPRYRRILLL